MTQKEQATNKNRAVLNRRNPKQDRSRITMVEELQGIYPRAKPEHIERALETFRGYPHNDDENTMDMFGKVLASIMIDDFIVNSGGPNGHN